MADIKVDAKSVKELRDKTGLPMMDCKRALQDAGGSVEAAYDALRKAGLKAQEKLSGRAAEQGKVASYLSDDGKFGVLVALRCETDPVAKNPEFLEFLDGLLEIVKSERPADAAALKALSLPGGSSIEEGLTDLVNQIRENITIGAFSTLESDAVAQYVHFDGKKAAMVALQGVDGSDPAVQELGKNLCMHVVFSQPKCLSRDRLDPEIVRKEEEILIEAAKNDPKNAKKPEEIIKKIVSGQVEKFVSAQCLLEQPYVRDEKLTVDKFVRSEAGGATLVDFAYVATNAE